jgi:type I restriction enzyme S subunit
LSNVDKKTTEGERPIRLCNYTDVYKNSFINKEKSQDFMLASCNENEYEKFILRKGQVAITKDSEKRNDIGIPTFIAEDFDDVVLGYHLALITPFSDKLDGAFLNFWLKTEYGKKYFENNASGSGQRLTLTLDIIKSIPLYLPDLPTQKSIAKVLSDLDAKIELNNKINRELEAMAKTLYDYCFVQFDFPDANGKPYKSSGGKMEKNVELKREIPEGWEVKKLGELLKKYVDKSTHIESKNILNDGRYPVITQDNGDIVSGFTNESNPIEDFPLIIFGDHSCTLRYIDFPFFRGADGTQLMYFDEDLTIYIYLFLQMVISQIPGYGKYERHYKYLKEFKVIVPDNQNLKRFQHTIKPVFEKISQSRLQNQHLTALRDWLLPMLMNGQVTIKEAEEKLSMAAEPSVKYGK